MGPFPSQKTGRWGIGQPNFGVRHIDKQSREEKNFGMNYEALGSQSACRHSHAVNPTVGNCHGDNLRAKRWEWRKTDRFELNLFAVKQTFAQVTQGDGEPEPGKRPARLNVNPFGHILMVFAYVCAGNPSQKIRGEFTLRLSIFRFFPRPFFLDQLWLLSQLRVFLINFTGGEFVSDDDM